MNTSDFPQDIVPKKKYQIFISSAYEELKEQRKGLIDTILKSDHIPSGMEMFSAGDEDEFEVIKEAINQSDIYVALVGAQYGSTITVDGEEKSYTQLEFEYATREAKKPYIIYLLNDDEFTEERNRIDRSDNKDKRYDRKIREFRDVAKKGQIVDFFSSSNMNSLMRHLLFHCKIC